MSARQAFIAKALIRNRRNNTFLLLRRSARESRPEIAHRPDIPGGTVEKGETFAEGCRREIREEVGLDIALDDLHLVYTETAYIKGGDVSISRALFSASTDSDDVALSWEHEAYEWVSLEELEGYGLPTHWHDAIMYAEQHSLIR